MTKLLLFSAVVLIATVSASSSRTWYVKADSTGDVPTIQVAIDSARSGDIVLVAAGEYTWANQGTANGPFAGFGMVFFQRMKSNIEFRSESGPAVTVLDAQRMGRVMFLQADNTVTIDGFTMKNGEATLNGDFDGGGITAHLADPTFKNCIIRNCSADRNRGGMWFGGVSAPRFENCKFLSNSAQSGGGVYLINTSTSMTFVNCVFRNNSAWLKGGGVRSYNARTILQNCEISSNSAVQEGGGFCGQSVGSVAMLACTVSENASALGGGIRLEASTMTVQRSIVVFSSEGAGLSFEAGSSLLLDCSNIYGNAGGDDLPPGTAEFGGNLSVDPQFCGSLGTGYYMLQADSYCAEGNHPTWPCGLIGAYPAVCGNVPAEKASWGRLKALYGD